MGFLYNNLVFLDLEKMTSPSGRKLLLVADELGRNASRILLFDDFFKDIKISVITKPQAIFEKVTEDIEHLTKNFTKYDNVVILAGINNATMYRKIDKNRIDQIVHNLMHTNLIIVSIPLWANRFMINDVISLNNLYLKQSTDHTTWSFFLDVNKYLYRKSGKNYILVPVTQTYLLRKIIDPIKSVLVGTIFYRMIHSNVL